MKRGWGVCLVLLTVTGAACNKGASSKPAATKPAAAGDSEISASPHSTTQPGLLEWRGPKFTVAYYSNVAESGEQVCYRLEGEEGVATLKFWLDLNAPKFERLRGLQYAPSPEDSPTAGLRLSVNDEDGSFHDLPVSARVPTEAEMEKPRGTRKEYEQLFTDEDLKMLNDVFMLAGKKVDCRAWPEGGQ